MSRLEVVDLNFTRLHEEEVTTLLHRLEENGRPLKDLTLSSNDLSQVRNCLGIKFRMPSTLFFILTFVSVVFQRGNSAVSGES